MSINHRQFTILQEMGIPLWQQKKSSIVDNSPNVLDIDIKTLSQYHLFNDILLSLGLSLGEISCEKNQISLGLLNWQFSEQNNISIDNNILITPEIKNIQQSPQLKAQLWQQLQEYRLI
ncbi:MAG: DNA polymerase III psi subunit [Alteromonadaceae bacterium]|jgi:DNA polymerase III psi subunit